MKFTIYFALIYVSVLILLFSDPKIPELNQEKPEDVKILIFRYWDLNDL